MRDRRGGGTRGRRLTTALPGLTLVLSLLLALVLAPAVGCQQKLPEYPYVEPVNGAVRIPLVEVADGEVHFYSVAAGGKRVNFLVRTDGTGALQVHLDACYGCYRYRLGYTVEEDALVCRACRLEYPIADEVWDFIGACAPIPVHSRADGDDLVIEQREIDRAVRYF